MNIYNHNELNEINKNIPEISKKSNKKLIILIAVFWFVSCVVTAFVSILISNSLNKRKDFGDNDAKLSAIAETYIDNVVEIEVNYKYGTGIIMDYDGDYPIIMTNKHVSGLNAEIINIKLNEKNYVIGKTEILGYDEYHDICILLLKQKSDKKALKIMDSPNNIKQYINTLPLIIGQKVLAIGNAMGKGLSVCDGIVSAASRVISVENSTKNVPVTMITAPINGGNSGGPLFDMDGKLVGINTYQQLSYGDKVIDNISYTIPINIAVQVYKQVIRQKTGGQTFLQDVGLTISDSGTTVNFNDLGVGAEFDYQDGIKLKVSYMIIPIDGLAVGDVITQIGDYKIDNDNYANIFSELYNYGNDGTGKKFTIKTKKNTLTFDNLKFKI